MLINIYTIVIQLINIAILYITLKRFLLEPLENFIQLRRQKIQQELEEAKTQREKANLLQKEYTNKLEKAKHKIHTLLENAKKEAEQVKGEKIQQAEKEANKLIKRATQEIERAKRKATKELLEKTADISLLATEKILEDYLMPEHHRKIIQEISHKIGDGKWAK